jgi:nitrate reductase cytochrome c-type subunit
MPQWKVIRVRARCRDCHEERASKNVAAVEEWASTHAADLQHKVGVVVSRKKVFDERR